MNSPVRCLRFALGCLLLLGIGLPAAAATVVSNLTAAQRAGTALVDIGYDLQAPGYAAVTVTLEASSDGGATWTLPVLTVSGDVGSGVAPGTGRAIVWDAGADWPGNVSQQMRFRVTPFQSSVALQTCRRCELRPRPCLTRRSRARCR